LIYLLFNDQTFLSDGAKLLILPSQQDGQHTCKYVTHVSIGERGSVVVKALCYKPGGEFLNLPSPSGRSRPWGLLSL
jgi:hypothetical protein